MLKSIKRRLNKNKKTTKPRSKCVDLDSVSSTLSYRQDMGLVFDPKKLDDSRRLLNYFFIVGPSKDDPNKPSLLLSFPSHRFRFKSGDFERVIQFCYPEGVQTISKKKNEISQFTFGLNDQGSLIFGIVTRFNTQLFSSVPSNYIPICLVSVTSSTLIKTHMDYHKFLMKIIKFCEMKRITDLNGTDLLDENNLFEEFNNSPINSDNNLENFYRENFGLHLSPINPLFALNSDKISNEFLKAVELLFRFQLFDDRIQFVALAPDITIEIPSHNSQTLDIGRIAFSALFECLTIADVCRYFRAVLLEQPVLLISDDVSTLSLCALASLLFVSPMSTKSAFLPILPDDPDFLDYLDTPTPFIFGALDTDNLKNYPISSALTIVDLVNGSVDYPDDVCHIPNISTLKDKLKEIIKNRMEKKNGLKPIYCDEITDTFKEFNEMFVSQERLDGCRVRDTTDAQNPVVGFVKDAFMVNVNDTEVDFYDALIETQTFQDYCESTYRFPKT